MERRDERQKKSVFFCFLFELFRLLFEVCPGSIAFGEDEEYRDTYDHENCRVGDTGSKALDKGDLKVCRIEERGHNRSDDAECNSVTYDAADYVDDDVFNFEDTVFDICAVNGKKTDEETEEAVAHGPVEPEAPAADKVSKAGAYEQGDHGRDRSKEVRPQRPERPLRC